MNLITKFKIITLLKILNIKKLLVYILYKNILQKPLFLFQKHFFKENTSLLLNIKTIYKLLCKICAICTRLEVGIFLKNLWSTNYHIYQLSSQIQYRTDNSLYFYKQDTFHSNMYQNLEERKFLFLNICNWKQCYLQFKWNWIGWITTCFNFHALFDQK